MNKYQDKLANLLRKSSEKAAEAVENFDAEQFRNNVVTKTKELYEKAKEIKVEDIQKTGKAAVEKVKNFDREDLNLDVSETIQKVLAVPSNVIDRDSFLREAIGEYVSDATIREAIAASTKDAGIRAKLLDMIADKVISAEAGKASGISLATGSMWATLPADIVQYVGFVVRIVQKLAYLYGYPEFAFATEEGTEVPKETLTELTKLVDIMFHAEDDEEGKSVSSKMGKLTLAKGIVAPVPILGGVLSGGVTYATLRPYAMHLKKVLSEQYEPGEDTPSATAVTAEADLSQVEKVEAEVVEETTVTNDVKE